MRTLTAALKLAAFLTLALPCTLVALAGQAVEDAAGRSLWLPGACEGLVGWTLGR